MLYLFQVILYTMAMLAIYIMFLRNRPLYQLSRYYLISSAVIPLIMPLIHLPERYSPQLQNEAMLQFYLPAIIVSGSKHTDAFRNNVGWFPVAYLLVAGIILVWQFWQGFRIWQLIRNNQQVDHGAYKLIIAPDFGPGSFGSYIFFPDNAINDTILAHECAHIQLNHTRDMLLLTSLQAFIWPNILLMWIKKELQQVHEFQADELVNADKAMYSQLLLSSVFQTQSFSIIHSFIIHPLKRRIMMLQKSPLGQAARFLTLFKIGAATMLSFLCLIYMQSCNPKENKINQQNGIESTKSQADALTAVNPPVKEHDPSLIHKDYDTIYDTVTRDGKLAVNEHRVYNSLDGMDRKPESNFDVPKFLADNLKYPEDAKKKGIQGRVVIHFIVNENGKIVNPEIVRTPDISLGEEALRVIRTMPDWKPGTIKGKPVAAYFYLPILFQL